MNKYIILFFVLLFIFLCIISKPELYPGDSAEFVTASKLLSIGHPSGFSIYIILGKFFTTLFFFADPLDVMCYTSTFYLILSILFTFLILDKIFHNTFFSLIGSVNLLFLPSISIYGFVPEVYTLNLLFLSVCIYISLLTIEHQRYARSLLFFSTIGILNHITFIFFFPVFVFVCFKYGNISFKHVLIIFLVGISIILYLPLRSYSGPVINWGEPKTFSALLGLITGSEKKVGSELFKLPVHMLFINIKNFISICIKEFNIFLFFRFYMHWNPERFFSRKFSHFFI